jgi:Pyridoxamine 5'-phosphate oxidase
LPNRHPPIVLPPPARLPVVTAWNDFEREAPELAAAVETRLTATLHSILGTLRADGAPRLTGLEVHFGDGELWLAMMPDSRKADDLRRDPRFSLHSAPDVDLVEGDAKVSGQALPVTDEATIAGFVDRLPMDLPPSGMALFRAELTDASLTRVDGDFMVIDVWRPGQVPRQVRRQ